MKVKINLNQSLFDMSFIGWIVLYMFFVLSTVADSLHNVLLIRNIVCIIASLGALIVILNSDFRRRDFVLAGALIICGLLIMYNARSESALMLFIFCIAAKSINFSITFRKLFRAMLVTCILILGLALLGIIPNKSSFGAGFWNRRTYLGFGHPNYCGAVFLNLIFLRIFNAKGKFRVRDYLFILCIESLNLLGPKSKTSLGLGILAMLAMFFIENTNRRLIRKITSKIKYLPIFLIGVSLLFVVSYYSNSAWAVLLNALFSGRIDQAAYFWNHYEVTLFGQVLENVSSAKATTLLQARMLDNGYFYMLLGEGVVFTAIFVALAVNATRRLLRYRQYRCILILAIMFLWGLMESALFRLEMNVALLLLAVGLYPNIKGWRSGNEKY